MIMISFKTRSRAQLILDCKELSVLQPVSMITISNHVFDDSSTNEYIDMQPFKLPAVNGSLSLKISLFI